ncbi:MAG TPA: hypothetical protein VN370_07905 [Desulfitobacteriaceae bacterium]|nr:hypothetical protein [Desulfitobacteriaceae bacterium]
MAGIDVTSQVILLGNPFTKDTFAKNVWDMQVFNDRIYLAHGDFNTNAGPIPIIYFDPDMNIFTTQFTAEDEEINNLKVINGKLYIPGIDAKENWNYGNFYVIQENSSYIKYRTIPNANHVFDIAYFNGQLYAAAGTTKTGWGEVLTSNDMGQTWSTQMPQANNIWTFSGDWATTLFELNNKLYAAGKMYSPSIYTAGQLAKYMNLIAMDGTKSIVQPYTNSFTQGGSSTFYYYLSRPTKFDNYLVFLCNTTAAAHGLSDSMYAATSLTKSRKVVFPESAAKPSDLLVRDKTIYVLANVKNSTTSYTNIVYQSTDLQTWTEIFHFDTDTFARSFEELNGDFYFGLGCDTGYLPPSTGNILKVPEAAYQIA